MKNKGIIILLPLLLLSSCNQQSSSITPSTLNPITINSLKEGLLTLSSIQNYRIDYVEENNTVFSYIFTENAIGIDSKTKEYINTLIEDENGIYDLKYHNGYKPGEYKKDADNNNIKNLWSSNLTYTLFGKSLDYINSIDDNLTTIKVSNKSYKMAIIQTLGYSSDDYVSLDEINITYDNNSLIFDVHFTSSPVYSFVASSFNATTHENVNKFLSEGGKVYTPDENVENCRRLMRASNFTRDIFDFSTNSYTGLELFNKKYFYYETTGTNFGQGTLEMNQKANAEHNFDLYGCYPFVLSGNLKSGFYDASFYNTPNYTKPNVEEMYHYPLYMTLWDNIQFIEKGAVDNTNYNVVGDAYHVSNLSYIIDFATNFSINQSFPFNEFVPFGLGININYYDGQDEHTTITFMYCFTYQKKDYVMPIPFYNFGVSNIKLLDDIYTQYND